MPTQELLQVRAAARQLGIHENTLRRWEEAGLIRAVRLPSGVRRFRVEDISRLHDEIFDSTPRRRTNTSRHAAGV
jgi:excisionase family DNA binding protein